MHAGLTCLKLIDNAGLRLPGALASLEGAPQLHTLKLKGPTSYYNPGMGKLRLAVQHVERLLVRLPQLQELTVPPGTVP